MSAVGGESEVTTEASGGAGPGADVGVVPADAGGEPPVPLPGSEDTPAPAQPEGSGVAGQKKQKKKPRRVQVALNTLRGEGVEAFKAYIEAEIGEAGPLHLACLREHTAIVKILLNAGADMDEVIAVETADADTESYTPYGIAELMGHREIMTLLEQHRQARAVEVEALSPEDEPGRSSPSTAPPEPASLPAAAQAVQTEQIPLISPAAAESRATGSMEPADRAPPSVLSESTVPGSRPARRHSPPTPGAGQA